MEKNRLLLLFTLSISTIAMAQPTQTVATKPQKMNLREAINKQLIRAELVSTGGLASLCINITIWNKTKKPISIELAAGEYLTPEDPAQQQLLVAKTVELVATTNEKPVTASVFAFCSQLHQSSPRRGTIFSNKKTAPKQIFDLAKLIETSNYLSYAAQEAVWCLTDDADIRWIMSNNSQEENELRAYVAAIKGIDLTKLNDVPRTPTLLLEVGKQTKTIVLDRDYKTDDSKNPAGKRIKETQKTRDKRDMADYKAEKAAAANGFMTIEGVMELNLTEPCLVTIEIISPDGKKIAEVYKSQDVMQGKGKFPYKFQEYGLPKGDYMIRAVGNGKVKVWREISYKNE